MVPSSVVPIYSLKRRATWGTVSFNKLYCIANVFVIFRGFLLCCILSGLVLISIFTDNVPAVED